ncbi:Uncharacterised protein [Candidatus Bilamarchaeum dharawalense]|uniref:Uncharacterized protein n=1 Tax=Candidatus Bilamarchaeum dharawalense TaxID=2885759 RepID=A0A5E4LQD9_9ARCH|nr:Uncharacterised protein [Candidatus Bilamarchaeum dharawalense]
MIVEQPRKVMPADAQIGRMVALRNGWRAYEPIQLVSRAPVQTKTETTREEYARWLAEELKDIASLHGDVLGSGSEAENRTKQLLLDKLKTSIDRKDAQGMISVLQKMLPTPVLGMRFGGDFSQTRFGAARFCLAIETLYELGEKQLAREFLNALASEYNFTRQIGNTVYGCGLVHKVPVAVTAMKIGESYVARKWLQHLLKKAPEKNDHEWETLGYAMALELGKEVGIRK